MRKTVNFKKLAFTWLLMASALMFLTKCKKEDLNSLPSENLSSLGVMPDGVKQAALSADGIISSSFYLENALPAGYVKDGSRDYTSYIQAAVSKYSNIVFPAFPLLVSDIGITVKSNKVITFLEGSEIRLKGTSKERYTILDIDGATNVTLYSPVIVGDRNNHLGSTGEHGVGIGIRGSSNVTLYSPRVTNCWGDGIYIGQTDNRNNCKNITIKDAYLRKNRRDGISIIGVDGLLIENIYAGYSDGTTPMSGINFEPNNTYCEIKNVKIINPHTEYNGSNGIQIGMSNLLGSSDKYSDITIYNHLDISSPRFALKMRCNNVSGGSGKMYGTINVVNPKWVKTGTDQPFYISSSQPTYKTSISSAEVMTTSGETLSVSESYDLLMKQSRAGVISILNTIPSGDLVDVAPPTVEQPQVEAPIVAINSGGSSFTASNGITYSTDKYFSGGRIYNTTNSVSNTVDDRLYQSERFGDFDYNIPLADGTYEITFMFAEIYHSAIGDRRFDVYAESNPIISNLDIFASAGEYKALQVVKTVTITDGSLDLDFRTDIDNAKISAFHIKKVQ